MHESSALACHGNPAPPVDSPCDESRVLPMRGLCRQTLTAPWRKTCPRPVCQCQWQTKWPHGAEWSPIQDASLGQRTDSWREHCGPPGIGVCCWQTPGGFRGIKSGAQLMELLPHRATLAWEQWLHVFPGMEWASSSFIQGLIDKLFSSLLMVFVG